MAQPDEHGLKARVFNKTFFIWLKLFPSHEYWCQKFRVIDLLYVVGRGNKNNLKYGSN